MTHTPTPWAYEPFVIGYGDPDWAKYIINSGGDEEYTVATIIGDVSAIDAEANAAFIVRCVNSHDKLVEALRFAVNKFRDEWDAGPPGEGWQSSELIDWVGTCDELLEAL